MNPNQFRWLEAESLQPPTREEREISRILPSLLSKTLSELESSSDSLNLF